MHMPKAVAEPVRRIECKRRSNNPSVKRPGEPRFAPE